MVTDKNINANSTSTTSPVEMESAKSVGFYVVAKTGQHSRHIVTLQKSGDGVNWEDTPHIIFGEGSITDITTLIAKQVRAKVTRTEGTDAVSTIDITIIVK